jgi:hypothetical protein
MSKKHTLIASTTLFTALTSAQVLADPTCTKQDKKEWLDFGQAKQQIIDMGYKIKNFKETNTGCYELYGFDNEGKHVEIYFNPVNLNKVKEEIDG